MKTSNLLTPREVSEILRRPLHSVYELVRLGRLAAVRDGPKLLKFRLRDVENYIARNLQQAKGLESGAVSEYIRQLDTLA